jgi:hypothetical protein
MNRLKLIGGVLIFSAVLDAGIAQMLPDEVRIYLYAVAGVSALIGVVCFLRGSTSAQ